MRIFAPILVSILFFASNAAAQSGSIHMAIIGGDLEQVEALLDEDPGLLQATIGPDSKSLLCFATGIAPRPMVELLTDKGMDFNEKSPGGLTLLHVAAFSNRNPSVTELFLELGLEVNARATGENVLGATPLHAAAGKDNTAAASLLIKAGAAINAKEQVNSYTPLHVAALNGQLPMAEMLIAAGADVNARTPEDKTPLSLAVSKAYLEMVDLLKKNGAVQ